MPLIRKTEIGDGFLALWELEESAAELLGGLVLSADEQAYYERISAEHRRREWLAWHRMIRELVGEEVTADYDAAGAPVLTGDEGMISVSHSGPWVALYYRQRPCGVDIERLDRRFDRVAARYISPGEWALQGAESDERFRALMWSTKEAVYKYAGARGLGFLDHIRVTALDTTHALVSVSLRGEPPFPLRYEIRNGYCLVYTL